MNASSEDRSPVERLAEEFAQRLRQGERPQIADYLAQYPEHADAIQELFPALILLEHVGLEQTNPPSQSLPQQFGDYLLIRELGRGGMGVVYEAHQESLDRRVALKILTRGVLTQPNTLARFQIEARAAGRLHHTNIVPVYGTGTIDGTHFYAMQYIPGRGLHQVIAEKRPADYRATAAIALQVAEALAHAHRLGVLHRDIKPSNLILDEQGTVWLTDFGLAKTLDGADLSRSGDIVGTVAYMAPERFQGQSSAQSDIYGLGLVLYELLTCRPAFGDTDRARLIDQVLHQTPNAPRQIDPGIPRDLETIVLKCVARNPGDRYAQADEVAEDLRRFLSDRPVTARRISWPEQVWRWGQRNRVVAGLLGAVLLLLSATAIGGVALSLSLRQALDDAEDERQKVSRLRDEARRDAYIAEMYAVQHEYAAGDIQLVRTLLNRQVARQGEEDWRGFEWQFWNLRTQMERRILPGSRDVLNGLTESSSGRYLAAAGGMERVWLWDRQANDAVQELQGPTSPVVALVSNRDGLLASADRQGKIYLWQPGRTQPGKPLVQPVPAIDLVFHPEGKLLASAGDDGSIRLWDIASGKSSPPLRGHTLPIRALAFSPDGDILASVGDEPGVRLWDMHSNTLLKQLPGPAGLLGVAFHPDGKRLAYGSWENLIRLLDLDSGKIVQTLTGHVNGIGGLAFRPDGRYLASGSWDNSLRLWDLATGENAMTLRGHEGVVRRVLFTDNGRQIASASWDGSVRLWDSSPTQLVLRLGDHGSDVWDLCFSPDGRHLATASWDGSVRIWDALTGAEVRRLSGQRGGVRGVSWSADGRLVAAAGEDTMARIWDSQTGKRLHELPHELSAATIAFSPDGMRVATGGSEGKVRQWDAASGKLLGVLPAVTKCLISGVAYSPDGQRLAAVGDDRVLYFWDVPSGKHLRRVETKSKGFFPWMGTPRFSPDGQRIALADSDSVVRVWNANTGEAVLSLQGHTIEVRRVAFSPDGKRLATASGDTTVRLWDAESGRPLLTLQGNVGGATAIAFSPDGKRLAAGGTLKHVRIWETEPVPDAVIQQREAVAARLRGEKDAK